MKRIHRAEKFWCGKSLPAFICIIVGGMLAAGCMPYHPQASRVTTGPVPTIKRPDAVYCDPQKVIDRSIQARGGPELLKRLSSVSYSGRGKSAPQNKVENFRFRTMTSLPDRMRDESDYEAGVKFVQVLDRDKNWYSINGDVKEMDAVTLQGVREHLHVNGLLTLVTLKDPRLTLSPLPDQRKEGVMVEGFVVKCKDQRDVSLYFEKDNGLLLSARTRAIDPNTYIEKDQESYFTQYVTMHGIQFPRRWVIYSDGNKSMELTFEDFKFLDKVDDIFFARPVTK